MRPLVCVLGYRSWRFRALWEAILKPLGGRSGASWGLIWASWGPLGASWGPLGRFLGPLGGLLGPSVGFLGRKARIFGSWSPSWAPLGAILGPFWAVLGASWAVLGLSWAVLGPLGGLLGGLGAVLEASWAVLERREAETARRQTSFKHLRKMSDFGLVGLSWAASWRPLGVSWRPLGPSWAHLGRLGPIFRRLEAFLDHLVDHLGAVRASRKRVCRNGADSGRLFRRLPPAFRAWPGPYPGGSPPRPPQGDTQREPLRQVGEKPKENQ